MKLNHKMASNATALNQAMQRTAAQLADCGVRAKKTELDTQSDVNTMYL